MDKIKDYARSFFTISEMTRPSAFPANCLLAVLVKDGYQMPFENPSPLLASPSPSRSVMYT